MRKLDFSLIYVYYNTPDEILYSIKSFRKINKSNNYEIIIVNNNSPKRLPVELSSDRSILIINNKKNIGFGSAHNQAVKKAKGEMLILQNPDTEFVKFDLNLIKKKFESNRKIGVIGPKVYSYDNKVLDTFGEPPYIRSYLSRFSFMGKIYSNMKKYLFKSTTKSVKTQFTATIGGVSMIIRKDAFIDAKGFDQRFFMYFEESDLCIKIKECGYRVLYFTDLQIRHMVGASNSDSEKIRKIFEKSRYEFFKKYQGRNSAVIAELFLRGITLTNLVLFSILLISGFLSLYKINSLIPFIGDYGTDYLTAYRFVKFGEFPLVGITSSVVWLKQGPLSVYLISLALLFGKMNPIAPAVLYATLNIVTTYLIFKLGKLIHSNKVGLLSSLFFATSSLIVMNGRVPYHTSSIPFFIAIYLIVFYHSLSENRPKLYYLSWFILGLITQLELSNTPLILSAIIVSYIYKRRRDNKIIIKSLLFYLLGIIPFIVYDIFNGFRQTFGFALWIANRIRLFLGITTKDDGTQKNLLDSFHFGFDQLSKLIFPYSEYIVIFVLFITIAGFVLWYKSLFDKKKFYFLSIPILVLILGFVIHSKPGPAYFPVLFSPISVFIGIGIYEIGKRFKIFIIFFVLMCLFNSYYIVSNNYYLDTYTYKGSKARGWEYSLGPAISILNNQASAIAVDTRSSIVNIKGGGFLAKNIKWVDNYRYLLLYRGVNLDESANTIYVIYPKDEVIKEPRNIIFEDEFIYIEKLTKN